MRLLVFLLLPTALFAQSLSVAPAVITELKALHELQRAARAANDGVAAYRYDEAKRKFLIGKQIQPTYLKDRHGEVWNLGVLDQPFVVHGISNFGSRLNGPKIQAINRVARAYATEMMTFLLMPEPSTLEEEIRLASIDTNVVVVFMDMSSLYQRTADDTRLLGLMPYPVTYFVDRSRTIRGVHVGAAIARPAGKRRKEVTEVEAVKENTRQLEKGVRRLLKGKAVKGRY